MPIFLILILLLANIVAIVAIPPVSSIISQYTSNAFLIGPDDAPGSEFRYILEESNQS